MVGEMGDDGERPQRGAKGDQFARQPDDEGVRTAGQGGDPARPHGSTDDLVVGHGLRGRLDT
jgi:hypothetical protein